MGACLTPLSPVSGIIQIPMAASLSSHKFPIRVNGKTDHVALISCATEEEGGGLFRFDGTAVERMDRLSSTGLLLHGDKLLRIIFTRCAPDFGGEILVYDAGGVRKYFRIDEIPDAHYLEWDGENYVVVATWRNRLVWVSPGGDVVRALDLPGELDSWHLNGVHCKQGQLHVSAFGDAGRHRAWASARSGFILNLSTGEKVVTGLQSPHNPTFVDGRWLVCNSSQFELLEYESGASTPSRCLKLNGWTRGLALTDDYIFVGESAQRHQAAEEANATLAIVCRKSWVVLDRVRVASREIGDILIVPVALAEGVFRGFRTNPQRVLEADQYALFDRAGEESSPLRAVTVALSPPDCRIQIEAALPESMDAGSTLELCGTVTNLGSAILQSAPPHPVHLSYRWCLPDGTPAENQEPLRSRLTWALPPGMTRDYRVLVRAPEAPGCYILKVTLVQEMVAWFDLLDEANCAARKVLVR
jgi:acetolactate synthase I/II/III large subunit